MKAITRRIVYDRSPRAGINFFSTLSVGLFAGMIGTAYAQQDIAIPVNATTQQNSTVSGLASATASANSCP